MAQAHVRGVIDPPCPRHPKSEAIFVCLENECEEALACPECIVGDGDHNKHEITLLKNHLDTFKKKITDFKTNTREQILAPLKEMVDKVADELETLDPASSTILEEIDARGKQIIDRTNTLVTELKAKCSQIGASNRQMIEQYQRRLLDKITEIEADITALDNFLSADCKADIVNGAKTALCKKYQDLPYPDNIKEVSFKGSETPVNNVATLLGIIVIGNEQPVRAETDTEKIKRLENSIKDMEKTGKDYQAHIEKLQDALQNARKECQDHQAHIEKLQDELQNARKEKTADAHEKKEMQDSIDDLRAKLEQKTADAHEKKEMQDSIDDLRAKLEQSRSAMQQLTDCQSCHKPKPSCRCRTCPKCQYKGNDFRVSIVFHIICLGNYYIIRICIQFAKHTTDR
ncbi:myosin heavy chain, clone 203-like [Pecten maximus]|uniref:myosin heavy chain, clone 203-like n=1 Tax=Pecten maximus TaxID=6579 RepID=UPI00145912F9|nr:myosin heavy chain, clone 203-like [Pecten maximus]